MNVQRVVYFDSKMFNSILFCMFLHTDTDRHTHAHTYAYRVDGPAPNAIIRWLIKTTLNGENARAFVGVLRTLRHVLLGWILQCRGAFC